MDFKRAVGLLSGKKNYIFLGGKGSSLQVLITSYTEVSFEKFADLRMLDFSANSRIEKKDNFVDGYVGLISFDDYNGLESTGEQKSRVFKVSSAVVQRDGHAVEVQGNIPADVMELIASTFTEQEPIVKAGTLELPSFALEPICTDSEYLEKVAKVISEIKSGRYYQLNLLRYFGITPPVSHLSLLSRFFEKSGSHGSIFDVDGDFVLSFSPERFVTIYPDHETSEHNIESWPIKGTRKRGINEAEDEALIQDLISSSKDNAELHMIVDLMRNDLRRISQPKSIQVLDPGSVHSFDTVHHLVAQIKSVLNKDLKLAEIFSCLAPCGSITGAPKVEVIKAIRSLENRPRNWFMGNAFYLTSGGTFDSSVLIRTVHGNNQGEWEYAAGSGLVIKSEPQEEMREIQIKCRVICE